MNLAVIVSTKDQAGMNIRQNLLKLGFEETEESFDNHPVYAFKNARLYTTDTESIFCEGIDLQIEADMFIFATKHQSASGVHSLSVHAPGNWVKAAAGGKDNKLCVAPASHLRAALEKLMELNTLGFDVIQECTHHGPYLQKPCMFIEIGSDKDSWENLEAGEIIAKTIMHIILNKPGQRKAVLGIGGLHHTPNLTKAMLKSDIALGHVCPKYNLQNLTKEMILQAIEKTSEKVELVVLDWKGLAAEKARIVGLLDEIGIRYMKSRDL